MKKIFILLGVILSTNCAFGQGNSKEYAVLIKKADSLYGVKDYKTSAVTYSNAFKTNGWKGRIDDRYNSACTWALAGNIDSAFYQLNYMTNKMAYDEYSQVSNDSDLKTLHSDNRWQPLLSLIKENKAKAEATLNKPLVRILDTILMEDQRPRARIDSFAKAYGRQSVEFSNLIKQMNFKDSVDLIKIKGILDKYGWLGADVVGKQGARTIFLVIQHSDLKTQEYYLPMMREAVKNKKAQPSELALLEDRVLIRNGKKQIYGSQLIQGPDGKTEFSPIEDEPNVNKRRAAVGLEPLEDYAKRFGLEYKPLQK